MSIGDLEVDPDHRGRELGAILLRHIEAEAKQQGALGVTGRVVAKDVAAFPRLPAWYEEQGYNVQPIVAEPSKGGTYDVARIWKAVVQA